MLFHSRCSRWVILVLLIPAWGIAAQLSQVLLIRPALVVGIRDHFDARLPSRVKAKVSCHFTNNLYRDASQLPGVSSDQGVFANRIDQPRNTVRIAVDFDNAFRGQR